MIGMFFANVALLLIGCFIVGIGLGYGHFYRFAILELSPEDKKK